MAVKNITDWQVVDAIKRSKDPLEQRPNQILARETGESEKVCFRAMERAERRGLVEYGVSLRSGWLTEKGLKLLEKGG
jgi:hypothetical protein